jgi:hypothetical protein
VVLPSGSHLWFPGIPADCLRSPLQGVIWGQSEPGTRLAQQPSLSSAVTGVTCFFWCAGQRPAVWWQRRQAESQAPSPNPEPGWLSCLCAPQVAQALLGLDMLHSPTGDQHSPG